MHPTEYTVKVSEGVEETLIYSLIDVRSGQRVVSCLQDTTATDIFLFTTSRDLHTASLVEVLDGHPTSEFRGVAFSNFFENECSFKSHWNNEEVCLMRYDPIVVPGQRAQLCVATRTLSPNYTSDMESSLRPLSEIIADDPDKPLRMPGYERLMRSLGLAGLIECISYTTVSHDDFDVNDEVHVFQSEGEKWYSGGENHGEPWSLTLAVRPEIAPDGDEVIDFSAFPALRLIQVSVYIYQ